MPHMLLLESQRRGVDFGDSGVQQHGVARDRLQAWGRALALIEKRGYTPISSDGKPPEVDPLLYILEQATSEQIDALRDMAWDERQKKDTRYYRIREIEVIDEFVYPMG